MAARGVMPMAKCLLVTFLIYLPILCSSGTLVGFSYDARKEERDIDAAVYSFIERNNIPPSQFRIFASNHGALLDSLSNTGIISVDLFLSHSQAKTLLKSRSSSHLPLGKITSIVLAGFSKTDIFSLLPTLNTLQSTVKNSHVKVSAIFSLSCLDSLNKSEKKEMRRIMWFIQEVQSFIVVETQVDGELSMGDGFVHHVIQRAVTACKILHHPPIPLVLNVKSSVVPSGVEISEFSERVMDAIDKHSEIKKRISAIFVEILPIGEDVQKRLSWEKEMIFPSSHRELFNYEIHDTVTPVTNPATTSPIITVPSTNPVTVLPTNPMTPITVPSTNPDTTPITVPGMNPLPTPVTNTPLAPVTNPTNPVPSPTTLPVNSPVTNPVTTYPPAGGVPSMTPVTNPGTVPVSPAVGGVPSMTPVTNPGTVPVSPAVSGQSWCVAKSGTLDSALQAALDYACGIGGADCSVIQMSGSCYNPNSLQAHASYAFNSYYQKNPVPTSCDFGGAATIVNINPSTGTCVYPSSSSASGVNPASTFGGAAGTGTGTGTGMGTGTGAGVGFSPGAGIGAVPGPGSVLNTNNSAGSSTVFGSDTPTGSIGHSIHHPVCWTLFLSVVATACITGNIW